MSFLVTHQKPKLFDREKLMNAALRALGMRAHSAGELRDKLRRRGREEDVEAVMASLKEAGYLDDRQFAENYAATRLQNHLGKMRVIRDLRQRRVAPQPGSAGYRRSVSRHERSRADRGISPA